MCRSWRWESGFKGWVQFSAPVESAACKPSVSCWGSFAHCAPEAHASPPVETLVTPMQRMIGTGVGAGNARDRKRNSDIGRSCSMIMSDGLHPTDPSSNTSHDTLLTRTAFRAGGSYDKG
jgi:hypothetical protein